MNKSKQEIILKALINGQTIVRNGLYYAMSEDMDICSVGLKTKSDGTEEEILLRTMFDFAEFMNWCDSFTDDEIINISFNYVIKGD